MTLEGTARRSQKQRGASGAGSQVRESVQSPAQSSPRSLLSHHLQEPQPRTHGLLRGSTGCCSMQTEAVGGWGAEVSSRSGVRRWSICLALQQRAPPMHSSGTRAARSLHPQGSITAPASRLPPTVCVSQARTLSLPASSTFYIHPLGPVSCLAPLLQLKPNPCL